MCWTWVPTSARLGAEQLEKELGVLADNWLDTTEAACAQVASWPLSEMQQHHQGGTSSPALSISKISWFLMTWKQLCPLGPINLNLETLTYSSPNTWWLYSGLNVVFSSSKSSGKRTEKKNQTKTIEHDQVTTSHLLIQMPWQLFMQVSTRVRQL